MMAGARLDGMKVGIKRMTTPQAHFALGTFDLGAMSSPKRVEWVKMNQDAESMELWSKWSRRWNGRLTGAHKVLCNAGEIACKGRQDFYLGHHGGYMISIHSKIGQGHEDAL